MKVEQLMTKDVCACRPSDPLNCAAQILWENDCGIVPIVAEDGTGRVVGILTDRDICMAAYSQGAPPVGDLRRHCDGARSLLLRTRCDVGRSDAQDAGSTGQKVGGSG